MSVTTLRDSASASALNTIIPSSTCPSLVDGCYTSAELRWVPCAAPCRCCSFVAMVTTVRSTRVFFFFATAGLRRLAAVLTRRSTLRARSPGAERLKADLELACSSPTSKRSESGACAPSQNRHPSATLCLDVVLTESVFQPHCVKEGLHLFPGAANQRVGQTLRGCAPAVRLHLQHREGRRGASYPQSVFCPG